MIKKVLITGGPRGLSESLILNLEDQGYEIHIISSQIYEDTPTRKFHQIDLSKDFEVEKLKGIPRVDLIIYCSGVSTWGNFFDKSIDSIMDVININFISHLKITHYLFQGNQKRDLTKVIFISSTSSLSPLYNQLPYSISKACMNLLYWGLKDDLKKMGVHCMLAIPSSFRSDFWKNSIMKPSNPMDSSFVAKTIIEDIEANKNYSLPGTKAKIQFFFLMFFSTFFLTHLKNNLLKRKNL